jgi:hypothetical protein
MSATFVMLRRTVLPLAVAGLLLAHAAVAQQPPAPASAVGSAPPADAYPRAEFVFEERVTLAPATVLGDTDLGHRQYIPITGGIVTGPKLKGEVIPGGWDFQLGYASGCNALSADYFLRTQDGTVIHVLNQAFNCGAGAERSWTRPTFEAPKGSAYEWLTRGTFVGALEVEPRPAPAPAGATPLAIRIKFYQIK